MLIDPRILQPNPWNPNSVGPDNEQRLDASVKRLGMFRPILTRELADGTLQILGGQHRTESAIRVGLAQVPVHNLGAVDDATAKEIGLIDNEGYGANDAIKLAAILKELGTPEELSAFMPFSMQDLDSMFSKTTISLDDLGLDDNDAGEAPSLADLTAAQQHQLMRFKVPVEDAAFVTATIEMILKRQKFTDEDSLSNAGHALVFICNEHGKNS